MSYNNGLADLQRLFGTGDANAVDKSTLPTRVEQSSRSSVAASGAANVSAGDQTQLSNAAGVISQALSGSDVRPEKVAALQQSIASGNYHVASSDLADKLIDSMTK